MKNSTGYQLKVDVTYTPTGVNYEKWLNNGGSYTYEMDQGTVYIWASFDGVEWASDTEYLSSCEHITYTWYLNGKKSSNPGFYLDISKNGEVIETVTEFQTNKK